MSPQEPEDELLRIVPVAEESDKGLGNLSALIVEEDRAYVAPGALHGRSPVERGVRWVEGPEQVPDGRRCWIAWVTLKRGKDGERGYRGLTTCELLVDREAGIGYKHLGSHVNAMKAALDGAVDVDLPPGARAALVAELKARGLSYWRHAAPEVKKALRQRE